MNHDLQMTLENDSELYMKFQNPVIDQLFFLLFRYHKLK